MEMCYDGTLVMPSNFVVVSDEEMTYVEGGSTAVVYGTASNIRTRLSSLIALSLAGTADGAAIGALIGGPLGAAAGAILGNALFGSWRSAATSAHSTVEGIIKKYGTSKRCEMTTTTTLIAYCTGISVKTA